MTEKTIFSTSLSPGNVRRRDFILDKLGSYVDLPSSQILEVGVGNGRIGSLLASNFAKYFGIEIDPEYVDMARKNIPEGADVRYVCGSASAIPFKRKFDALLYVNCWHMIKRDEIEESTKEAYRVLDNEGVILIIEPTERTTSWASPILRKNSSQFRPELLERKLQHIRDAERDLREQNLFDIVEEGETGTSYFYVLKKK